MEKFEKEYRQMIQEDMPDLWGRIEAGLKEKELKKEAVAGTEKQEGVTWQQEERSQEVQETYKRWSAAGWRRYAVTAAAVVCVLFMIPAVLSSISLKSDMGGNSSSEAPVEAEGMYGPETDGAAYDTAMPEDTASGSSGPEDKAWENMESGAGEEAAESAEGKMNAAAAGETGTENTGGKAESADGEGESEGLDIEDGTVIGQVHIRVLETTDMQYHTVYHVTVEQDDSGLLTEGAKLSILSDHSAELKEGVEYRISVLYSEEASVPFRLVDWEEVTRSE